MMNLYDTLDMSWTHEGMLKVVRKGNAYEWQVFGVDNLEVPLFSGVKGSFFDAQHEGEVKLEKDLKRIFWILSEMSNKERSEGEPKDAELIEQSIRQLNVGDKTKALHFLDQAIKVEHREREPQDVAMLQQARTLILSEKDLSKQAHSNASTQGQTQAPTVSHKKTMRKLVVALGKAGHAHPETGGTTYCVQCRRRFINGFGHQVHDGKVHDHMCEDTKVKRPNDS